MLAEDLLTKSKVAIKKVILGNCLEKWKRTLREVSLLRQMDNKFIIKLLDLILEDGDDSNF